MKMKMKRHRKKQHNRYYRSQEVTKSNIERLIRWGYTFHEISYLAGLSINDLHYKMVEYSLDLITLQNELKNEIVIKLDQGLMKTNIAKEYGVTINQLNESLKKWKLFKKYPCNRRQISINIQKKRSKRNENVKAEVIKLIYEGFDLAGIADIIGVRLPTLRRYLKFWEIDDNQVPINIIGVTNFINYILKQLKKGIPLNEIAYTFKVPVETLESFLKIRVIK